MASVAPRRRVVTHSGCSKCRIRISPQRRFSSTPAALTIGPESPKYIDVPKPPQSDYTPKPKTRGFLPTLRGVFSDIHDPKGRVIKEALERRVAGATTEPSLERPKPMPKHAERATYKSRQAETRRRNLREGMKELLTRKEKIDQALLAKSRRNQAEREELISRPEREDERLTKGSVLSAMLQRGPLQDPNREERLQERRQNVAALQKVRSEHRRDALHTLYMNAQSFITNEAQLDQQIENEFGTSEKPRLFGYSQEGNGGTSYWDEATPLTTTDMLRGFNKEQGTLRDIQDDMDRKTRIIQERMRRMAEELTGGKM